ncbi:MAG TPA: D-amino acid dehydrogenase [Rhizomicrobium sp.]|nr:D-amino acid dehydrogenase [Rhizomicrobium sp.]
MSTAASLWTEQSARRVVQGGIDGLPKLHGTQFLLTGRHFRESIRGGGRPVAIGMKVIIIGSGLIGVTSAYFLARRGHDVTVLERADGPGRETSFANGAMLTAGMAEPWNSPGSWRTLLASLVRSDAALRLQPKALPSLVGWGITFLRNSGRATFERNALNILRLALYSREAMQSLRQELDIEYGRTARGSLSIFRSGAALEHAAAIAGQRAQAGLRFRRLSPAETIALEPGLAPIADRLAGAIHYETDETGDAYRFCEALAEKARGLGVNFRFGSDVSALEAEGGRVVGVASNGQRFVADQYVIAAGSYSTPLLRQVGINLPVRPAKGYSITFEDSRERPSLRTPIIDSELHAVVVPLDGAVRLAGIAEFAGFDRSLNATRIHNLTKLLAAVLPRARLDPATAKPWCGLRPLSTDGVAVISPTRLPNLWVNCGQGHLGWTTAAGSAKLMTSLLSGDAPGIDPAPYALSRFA